MPYQDDSFGSMYMSSKCMGVFLLYFNIEITYISNKSLSQKNHNPLSTPPDLKRPRRLGGSGKTTWTSKDHQGPPKETQSSNALLVCLSSRRDQSIGNIPEGRKTKQKRLKKV